MSSSEARQQRINEVVSTYQRYPGDTGSTEVQGVLSLPLLSVPLQRASRITYKACPPLRSTLLFRLHVKELHYWSCACCLSLKLASLCAVAILTVRILAMAEHMKVHRKDFSSRL